MANGPGESRFAIQCLPRHSLFAAPFPIYFFQCSLFKVRYSMFSAPFTAPFASSFAVPSAIRRTVSYSFSLFKLRYSMFAAPLAIRSSPFTTPFAVAFLCPLTLSILLSHVEANISKANSSSSAVGWRWHQLLGGVGPILECCCNFEYLA